MGRDAPSSTIQSVGEEHTEGKWELRVGESVALKGQYSITMRRDEFQVRKSDGPQYSVQY